MRRLQHYLKANRIDAALLFSPDPNYVYFTGSSALGTLVVPAKKTPFIISSAMEFERLSKETEIEVALVDNRQRASIKSRLPKAKQFGINNKQVTLTMLNELKKKIKGRYSDISGICEKFRAIKSEEEIKEIRKACRIDAAIKRELLKGFTAATELELMGVIETKMRERGGLPAFDTIVAAGSRSSFPHSTPSKAKLKGFCIMDFGVKHKNYNSDSTRTIFFGNPSQKEIRVYNQVLNTLEKLTKAVKPGMKISKLNELGKKLLEPYSLIHALGHGIGVDVHESPIIAQMNETKLSPGMVICIEPGIYLQGRFGVRIEDTILVTSTGCEVLTKAPRQLVCFKKR